MLVMKNGIYSIVRKFHKDRWRDKAGIPVMMMKLMMNMAMSMVIMYCDDDDGLYNNSI